MTRPSRSPVAEELERLGVRPSRAMGQCFMADGNLARAIVGDALLSPGEVVLEIGPGLGALTIPLLAAGHRVIAVELDRRLASALRQRLGSDPRFTLIEGDALLSKHQISPVMMAAVEAATELHSRSYSVVANLPYGISVPLILGLMAHRPPPRRLTVMVQLEVARRLAAVPGGKEYGAASVFAQIHGSVKLLRQTPREVFWPRPEVVSGVLALVPHSRAPDQEVLDALAIVLREAFQQRRRTMRNALARIFSGLDSAGIAALAERVNLDLGQRPETVPVAGFWRIAQELRDFLDGQTL